nr:hypothetical protein GCM10020093_007870 [Planobispora longispora]
MVEHGTPRGPALSLPVAYRGEAVGRLVLCRTELSEGDQRLLGDLVRQAAAAARATELSADLQRIRAQMVLAREEERRRLRRDLHDGLGPSLGALRLRVEAARNLAATAPARADRLLEQTAAEISGVLTEVRRLVHDLRPPPSTSWACCARSSSRPTGSARPRSTSASPGTARWTRCPPRWRWRPTVSCPRRWPTWSSTRTRRAAPSR